MVSKQRSALRYQSGLWMGSFQKVGNLTKCVHPQGAVEWRVPIVWETNEDDAQSEKCAVASKWAMDGECCQSRCPVEQRVPIVWGNGCRADQEYAEWQTNIAY